MKTKERHLLLIDTMTPWAVHGTILLIFYLIAKSALSFRDIYEALGFYGVYHREPWNQVIHFFGVPAIIWSLLVFLAHIPLPFLHQSITYADILTIFYLLFYLKMDPIGGLCYAPFLYWMYSSATHFVSKSSKPIPNKKRDDDSLILDPRRRSSTRQCLKIAAFVHMVGWYVQIHPGHYIIEGAAPAVTKSFGGALTSAPLFAFYEGLWFLGIRKDLQKQTLILVDQYTRELCKSGTGGVLRLRACSSATHLGSTNDSLNE